MKSQKTVNNILLYLITILIWGSTWIAIKYQVMTASPEFSIILRFLISSLLIFLWCWYRGLKLHFNFSVHKWFVLLGTLMFSLNYIGLYFAQTYISSALNSVVFSTMTFMNIVNSRIFFKKRITARVYAGALLGILGVGLLFLPDLMAQNLKSANLVGVGICLAGTLCASLGSMVSQKSQSKKIPVLQSIAWGMLYGSILTIFISIYKGVSFSVELEVSFVISLLYLSVFGSIIAFVCYLKLIGNIGSDKAGYVVVTAPVVAIVISYFFEDLKVTPYLICGLILILFGNVLVLKNNKSEKKSV